MRGNKIRVNGVEYNLIRKVYDPFIDAHLYYVKEFDEPFCDLNDDIEELWK